MAIRMASSERLREIGDLAETVADEHSPDSIINPTQILQENGITYSFGCYGSAFDGMLEHREGRFHVFANLDRVRSPTSGRSRFTLAHELGHYYIDDHRISLRSGAAPSHRSKCDFVSKNPVEVEADHFASHLLMPTTRVVSASRREPLGMRGVLRLGEQFGTSITSTALRLTKLNLAPYAIVKWTSSQYAWKWLAHDTFAAGYRRTIEQASRVAPDSPTARALRGEKPPADGYFQAGTTASAWFATVARGSRRDAVLIEHAIGLGEFGVLTMLFPEQGRF